MTNLRILGIVLGLLGLVTTFILLRGPKWKRTNFVLIALFCVCLIVVSIHPDTVNFLRDALSMQEYQYGRLIALIIISNIFLLFFSFYSHSKLIQNRIQFDRLVRSLVDKQIGREKKIAGKIKPIMVVIPAFNESDNLKELIPKIPDKIDGIELGIIVADDGSDDDTSHILSSHPNIIMLHNPINRGGGAALRLGYDVLAKFGANICVTMDADGQHLPSEIQTVVKPVLENDYDLIIGSRVLGNRDKDSSIRFLGVYVFRFLLNLLLGTQITDPSNGFRAFNTDILKNVRLFEDQYHTTELIIEARRFNFRIGEAPVTVLKRKYGKTKKGKTLSYGFHFTKVILKTWWRRQIK